MFQQVPQQTLEWLHQVLSHEYRDINRTYSDVVAVLQAHGSLAPRTSVYSKTGRVQLLASNSPAYENGKSALLLNLHGTLPASFRSAVYNIPVAIWIPHEYPYAAPFAFVTPTATMSLRAGNHVDTSGRVYHPYLSYWNPTNPQTSLVGLCTVLGEIFSKEPPVYGKQPPPAQQRQPSQPPAPSQPIAQPQFQQPGYPQVGQPTPTRGQNPFAQTPHYQDPAPIAYNLPPQQAPYHAPPVPPAPGPAQQSFTPQGGYNPAPAGFNLQNTNEYSPTPPLPYHAPQAYAESHAQAPAPVHHPQPPVPPQPQTDGFAFPPLQYVPGQPLQTRDLIDESRKPTPTAQPAPSLPPHPEQTRLLNEIAIVLQKKATEAQPQMQKQVEHLRGTLERLKRTEASLLREKSELERISDSSRGNHKILTERIKMAEKTISDAKQRGDINVDEIVCAEAAVFNQLYELVADDLAIEDTIYVLGKSLDRERIPLDLFLKHARNLAREQFLKRALVRKIELDTGLSDKGSH